MARNSFLSLDSEDLSLDDEIAFLLWACICFLAGTKKSPEAFIFSV